MTARREFIKQSGLFLAAAALAPSFACSINKPTTNVGLQLYSLGDIIGTDIKGIIAKVAAIGYKEVETYGYSIKDGFWGLDAKAFHQLLNENGLKAPSGHYEMDGFISDKNNDEIKTYIEAANIIGSEYVVVPYLQEPLRKTADDFKKIAAKLNEAGELCKAAGLRVAYHNHDFEFTKFGNTTGYEILLQNTDKKLVDFELDLYWTTKSGIDAPALFKANAGRFAMWHIKDMDKQNHMVNTEVGQGLVDFKSIFKEAKLAGVKHYYVEHEFNYKPDELGSIKTSFNYVKNELL